jgi:FkbM family methyltransferase
LHRIARFFRKTAAEKRVTVRFFSRKALSKLPFVPARMRFPVALGHTLEFWWSTLPATDCPDRTLFEYWGDDRGELRFLWKFLQPGMTFLDVGAYHGIFSLLAAMKMGSGERVIAFEPSPRERWRFEFHLRMNGISGARLEPYAVSARTGALNFFTVTSGFTSMNSLQRPPTDNPIREIRVEAIALDDYLTQQSVSAVELMKIDVEGGELQAFAGATHLLQSLRPIIICEVLDWVTQPWGYPAREIVGCLQRHDYVWFDFADDGTIAPHQPRFQYPEIRNYLAVPQEKRALIEPQRGA